MSEASYGPMFPRTIPRTRVPGGRHDRMVIREIPVFHHPPVRERSARRLVRANAFDLFFRKLRRIVPGHVAAEDIISPQFAMLQSEIGQHCPTDGASA